MKRFLAIFLLLAAPSVAHAQTGARAQAGTQIQTASHQAPSVGTLKPRRLIVGTDTLFAFSRLQVKELAKGIANSEFDKKELGQNVETIRALSVKLEIQTSITRLREKEVKTLEDQLAVRDSLLSCYEQQTVQQKAHIRKLDKMLEQQTLKYRLTTWLGIALLVLLLILLL